MNVSTKMIYLVDDDESFLKSLSRFLRASDYNTRTFSSAKDFLKEIPSLKPGCVLCDLKMPEMDGLAMQEAASKSDNPLPIVFISGHGDIPCTVKAMRQGADDFLLKTAPKEEILSAIRHSLAKDEGQRETRIQVLKNQQRLESLTPRERQVLSLILAGRLNKQVARLMNINERSVKRHRASVMQKLGVDSPAQLGQFASLIKLNS
jgi:FixJ family two-component response regulator